VLGDENVSDWLRFRAFVPSVRKAARFWRMARNSTGCNDKAADARHSLSGRNARLISKRREAAGKGNRYPDFLPDHSFPLPRRKPLNAIPVRCFHGFRSAGTVEPFEETRRIVKRGRLVPFSF
jgi:hypothetical protein